MAVLVALAGAGISTALGFGPSSGWLVGSVIGGLLFPAGQQKPAPPQIGDISVSSSANGAVIPRGFGTVRIAGQYIWAYKNRMVVQQQEVSAAGGSLLGKGGQSASSTQNNYFLNAMLSFGAGPCKDITRIWADGKLIYDKVSTRRRWLGGFQFRLYKGTEDQLPDPWLEKDRGAGNVAAYRGEIVLRIWLPLANFGNRPPSISAEVCYEGNPTLPYTDVNTGIGTSEFLMAIDWRKRRLYSLSGDTFSAFDLDTMTQLRTANASDVGGRTYCLEAGVSTGLLACGPNGILYAAVQSHAFDGGIAKIDSEAMVETAFLDSIGWPTAICFAQSAGPSGVRTFGLTLGSNNIFVNKKISVWDADTMALIYQATLSVNYYAGCAGLSAEDHAEAWVLGGGGVELHRISIAADAYLDGVTGNSFGVSDTVAYTLTAADVAVGATGLGFQNMAYDPTDDTLVLSISTANKGDFCMKWSQTVGVIFCVPVAHGPQLKKEFTAQHYPQYSRIDQGYYAYLTNVAAINSDTVVKIDTATGEYTETTWGAIADANGSIRGGSTEVYDGESDSILFFHNGGSFRRIFLDRGAGAATTLGAIVTGICGLAGVPPSDLDVSELTDSVDGYVLGRQMTAADALAPLRDAYFFDPIVSDWKIKNPKRPQALSVTIPEDDLAIVDQQTGQVLKEPNQQELELPAAVTVQYMDRATDYQQGSKIWRRPRAPLKTMQAAGEPSLALPIVFDGGSKPLQIAQKTVYSAWRERHSYQAALPWTYAALDPADVAAIAFNDGSSARLRLSKRDLGGDLMLAVQAFGQGDYTYASTADAGDSQWTPQPGPGDQVTRLFILDIPLLRDMDSGGQSTSILYWAAGPYTRNDWVGCRLYESADAASSGDAVGADMDACGWGSCLTALPDSLEPWGWDRSTVLTVAPVGGPVAFASAAELDVLAGANALAVFRSDGEAEIVQFVTATQNADGTWSLSQLLRGRRGTDVFCGGHAIGDAYVQLTTATIKRLPVSPAARGSTRWWRGVGMGLFPQDADVVVRATNARDLMPYMPRQIKAVSTGGGSPNINLSWVRRTRIGGEWSDGVDAPLSEASELYDVEILSGPGGTVKRTFSDLTSPSQTYSNANIIADFGSVPGALTLRVYQKSAVVGRGLSRETTVAVS